jgi:hypothetical protein
VMYRPSPVPDSCRVVELSTRKNLVNSLAWSAGEMPMPVSATDTVMEEPASSAATVTVAPGGEYLTALLSRLDIIWENRRRSPSAVPKSGGKDKTTRIYLSLNWFCIDWTASSTS